MRIIEEISTHKAVKNNGVIEIILKGCEGYSIDEVMYTIPLEEEDDVFAIMERYEEDNRCNVAEWVTEMS